MKLKRERILQFIKDNKLKSILFIGVFSLFLISFLVSSSFSLTDQIDSIELTSSNISFENSEPGSWKLTKSANWIDKWDADINLVFDSNELSTNVDRDVILVVDSTTTLSVTDEKRLTYKSSIKNLISDILDNENNEVALITFDYEATVQQEFTNDIDSLWMTIDNMVLEDGTNYYDALTKVNELMESYTYKDNKEVVVLFIVDGEPSLEIGAEVAVYEELKQNYELTICGIEYEMNETTNEYVNQVTDEQYITSISNLNNVLRQFAVSAKHFYNIEIDDIVNTEYFTINSVSADYGLTEISESTGEVVWTIETLQSGVEATLNINVSLKEDYSDSQDSFKTNTSTSVLTYIKDLEDNEIQEDVQTSETPILNTTFNVTYNGNSPSSSCTVEVPSSSAHSFNDIVKIDDEVTPSCEGYEFKGWKIKNSSVTMINSDNFYMPSENVEIIAKWGKVSLNKSMYGELYTQLLLYDAVKQKSLGLDNQSSSYVSSSSGIDFSTISSDTNGKGVYEYNSTADNEYQVYYFRGDISDNNLLFAGFCWKIVRTTTDGETKIIYNGTPSNGTCSNTTGNSTQIQTSTFNRNSGSLAYVGYMYGTVYNYGTRSKGFGGGGFFPGGSSSSVVYGNDVEWDGSKYTLKDTITVSNWSSHYDEVSQDSSGQGHHYTCNSRNTTCTTIYYDYYVTSSYEYYLTLTNGKTIDDALDDMLKTNTNDSTIKGVVDKWYTSNLTDYSNYLSGNVFCNDRTSNDDNFSINGDITNNYYFSFFDRIRTSHEPTLDCETQDYFTTSSATKGNKALTYPIGLLSGDEAMLAGGEYDENDSFYLYTNKYYWLSSAFGLSPYYVYMSDVYEDGEVNNNYVAYSIGVRPVVVLKHNAYITNGDGSSDSPYEIEIF